MKSFLLSFFGRAATGYLVLIGLNFIAPEVLSFLVWLAERHTIFTLVALFFSLSVADTAVTWIRVNLQHKGVGSKSRRHADTLKN